MENQQKIIILVLLLQGVWCEEWPISLPEKIEALSGSCVTINCTFTIDNKYDKDLTDSAVGLWFKDGHQDNNIVFNSSNSKLSFKGEITGKLKDKDCTTIFYKVTPNHKGTFNFRVEGNGGLKYIYKQKSVSIDVIDSPPNPTVQMFKDQMEVQEEVLEGSSVCLRCSAKTLCSSSPPTLTWSSTDRLHLNESSRLQLDQQKKTEIFSDLNFTATHLQHGVTFICTITYQLQQRITTAQRNITLRVRYAPKIFLFSCNRSDVTVCLCEAHGNPSPKVEWFLSGHPVSNSTNTSISEERLRSTDLRSFITLYQSLTDTDTLQCVTINTHGNASERIQLVSFSHNMFSDFIIFSVLIGAAGALVMMILCVITHKRRQNRKPSQKRREAGIILTNEEHEGKSVYANRVVFSPAEATTLNYPESLHYSSIYFTNTHTKSEEIRGVSSLTAEYAAVRHYSAGVSESSTDAQVIVSAEELKEEVKPKKSDQEMPTDSVSQLCAQVKR